MDEVRPAVPPAPYQNRKGKQPSLLTDDVVKKLLNQPEQWFIICLLYTSPSPRD